MKKTFLKSAVLAIAGVGLLAGSALALPVEWGVINPADITGMPSYTVGDDFGYYIWTDDLARTSWHIRWMDNTATNSDLSHFTGTIALQNSTGTFQDYSFEGGDVYGYSDTGTSWFNEIAQGEDGIDFTITQDVAPSYVGFNLSYNYAAMSADNIFLGAGMETVASLGEDQDFAMAAPVPEPATMLLFGTGLAGLAGFARRKKARKENG